MRLAIVLCALLPISAAGCGSSDPAELTSSASRALGQGDFASARADFDLALQKIGEDPSDPDYLRAKMGAIEARTKDAPDEAVAMFLALAKKLPEKVGPADYSRIGGRLGDSGHFPQAIQLVTVGKEAHPDSAPLAKLIQDLGDQAKESGQTDALDALKGLGYVGE